MNCGQANPLLDLNWNHTMDASGHYKSPPSSGISSSQPSSSATAADSMAFHKLMGGLQSIGNSDNGMAQPPHQLGAYLNSPPKLNLSMMGHFHHHQQQQGMGVSMPLVHLDQFSDFNVRNDNRITTQFGVLDANKLSRVGRLQIGLPQGRNETFVAGGLQLGINNVELANGREESSVSDPAASGDASLGHPTGSNAKKRRAPPKGKVKEASIVNSSVDPPKVIEGEEASAKRSRSGNESDTVKTKIEQHDGCSSNGNGSQKQGKDSTVKAPEPPKDYIHVRARRGQATDSHSLAERVRREKISQRMKLLQDLVPGCNKVTGKAVMLDEIINYVQSLQRQVEFLSMKLATVNPHLDFSNVANLLPKDMQQACGPMSNSVYSLETSEFTPPYINLPQHGTSLHGILPNALENQNSMNLLDSAVHHNLNTHHSFITGFGSAPSQIGGFWEDDLQNSTHMDIEQN